MRKNFAFLILLVLALPAVLFANLPLRQQAATAPALSFPIEENKPAYNDGWIEVEKSASEPTMGGREDHLDYFDTLLWCQDFEEAPEWDTLDLSNTGVLWHLTDTLALGGSGLSWWCADTTCAPGYGGAYDNNWLAHLKSDTLDLTGTTSPTLRFRARWKVEVPGGEPAGYDMWDGWNVWISTDAGATWDTLRATIPPSPPYTGESSYAFGSIWCMGPGISAWGDISHADAWYPFEFDLSGYKQDNVMLRWTFCSDGGFSGCSDDPTFFGLLVDSIRVQDGPTTIFSNDGTLDEMIPGGNPIAGCTWVHTDSTYGPSTCGSALSPDSCWKARQAFNLNCAVTSYLTPVLPVGYTDLAVRYWVWCNMPDSDGDNDNSLEDLYEWQASPDGVVWTRIGYDYGYDNGDPAPGGNSLTGWVYRKTGLLMPGPTVQSLSLKPWEGQQVYLRCVVTNDCNNDGGVGYGVHIDDVEIHGIVSFNHDLSCSEVIVPFPTTVGLTRPFGYRIVNEGLTQEGNIIRSQYWVFRPDGSQQVTASPVMTAVLLATAEDTVFTPYNSSPWVMWTPDVTGSYLIRARSNLLTDQDRSNDTAWTPTNVPQNSDSTLAVMVRPAGEYELAYHTREKASAFLNPRYVRYTPAADSVPSGVVNAFDITTIRVMWQYDELLPDTGALTWIEFWEAGTETAPGALINRIATRIDTNETVGAQNKAHWWTLNVAGIPGLQNRSGNFWVSLTAKDSIGGGPLPLPLGKSVDPVVYDGHHFVIRLDTVGTPLNPSPGRYLLQTTIKPAADPNPPALVSDLVIWRDDNTGDILLDWGPAAHATGYHVYRLTTPYQAYTTGTRLTSLPTTDTEYRDVGVVSAGAKYFYVVVGVN
jgi:hypothetical protein